MHVVVCLDGACTAACWWRVKLTLMREPRKLEASIF